MSHQQLTDRQRQIMVSLQEQGAVTISDLRQRLGVSGMTIHRDLDRLAAQGLVRKVRGGAVPAAAGEMPPGGERCVVCGKPVLPRSAWSISPSSGPRRPACCAHCGLLELARSGDALSALATDFLYGRMVNAYQASYVIDGEITLCCTPSTLCFAERADAEKFAAAFGGTVHDFTSALSALQSAHRALPGDMS